MRRKITKETNPASEYDSQRETRVLLEDMSKGIKIIAEQHGDVVKRLDNIDSEIGLIKSDVGFIKLELGSVKSRLGSVESELGSVKSELGSVKSELGSVKRAVMEVDNKLTISISHNEERFKKIEEKLCLN